jgi:PPE-repeat protein
VIAANRSLFKALVATNLFGQNTPAIAAAETHYAEMWAQDAAAMYGYAGVSASAATLPPFAASPLTTNPGGRRDQSAALTQATGNSAATGSQAAVARLTSTVPATLTGLSAPLAPAAADAAPASSIFDILQSLDLVSPSTIFEPAALGLGSSELSTAAGAWSASSQGDQEILKAGGQIVDDTKGISGIQDEIRAGFGQLGVKGLPAPVALPEASAGLGQAAPIGALSVPPAWTTAAPEMRLATLALPATSLGAAPEVFAGGSAGLFGEMTAASMAGQAINGTVSQGRERIGAIARVRSSSAPSTGGPAPGIADEIREFAEVLGKLGDLRDSGLLTHAEFNLQKERLLGIAQASV